MSYPGKSHDGNYRNRSNKPQEDHCTQKLLDEIRLKAGSDQPLPPDLFSGTAERVADMIAKGKNNQYTQVRKFYDELTMWDEKISQKPDQFHHFLPFVRMLNAKAAYAMGRKHLDECFVKFIKHCLDQMDTPESFRHGKLFFEAFLGYYRVHKNA